MYTNNGEKPVRAVIFVEEIFIILGKSAIPKKCQAMECLIKEAENTMESSMVGTSCDAGIVFAAHKVEHYEIASYSTLKHYAMNFGMDDIVQLLDETLKEEKNTDELLSEFAMAAVKVLKIGKPLSKKIIDCSFMLKVS